MGKIKRFYVATILLMFVAIMNAQVTTSSMQGKVLAGEEPVIGATVYVKHEPSGSDYVIATNEEGSFNLQGLRTGGPYTVEVNYIGYKKAIFEGINLRLGENYILNVYLEETSEMLDEVVVTANRPSEQLGTNTAVSQRQIETLPTINRSIDDFTKLSPFAGSSNSFAGI